MARADIIADFLAASTDFQPAAGVEIILTHAQGNNANLLDIKDGTSQSDLESWDPVVTNKRINLGITNTLFIGTPASSTGFYSGVQVQS